MPHALCDNKHRTLADKNPGVHFVAGGCGGLMSALVTCPLEVVKTRLQSSKPLLRQQAFYSRPASFSPPYTPLMYHPLLQIQYSRGYYSTVPLKAEPAGSLLQVFRHILRNEGPFAFFRGISPTVIGMAPSRAITLGVNHCAKQKMRQKFPTGTDILINGAAASIAGFAQHSATNPIWLIKTKLQLDQSVFHRLTMSQCFRKVYETNGIRGFWKGVTASYLGIPEIVLMLVTYEELKGLLASSSPFWQSHTALNYILCSGFSKAFSSTITYPHEVFRTRLREGNDAKYTGLWKTIKLVWVEEGLRGMFGGLNAQLMRQFPNTIITFLVYEYGVELVRARSRRLNENLPLP